MFNMSSLQVAVEAMQQEQDQVVVEQVAIVLQSLVKTQVAEHPQNL
tara:strand:- start:297 stop:434 length:138 start_codon:yes stop_codon:yes gene_type:complete